MIPAYYPRKKLIILMFCNGYRRTPKKPRRRSTGTPKKGEGDMDTDEAHYPSTATGSGEMMTEAHDDR